MFHSRREFFKLVFGDPINPREMEGINGWMATANATDGESKMGNFWINPVNSDGIPGLCKIKPHNTTSTFLDVKLKTFILVG
jgi:hypothetical protein